MGFARMLTAVALLGMWLPATSLCRGRCKEQRLRGNGGVLPTVAEVKRICKAGTGERPLNQECFILIILDQENG